MHFKNYISLKMPVSQENAQSTRMLDLILSAILILLATEKG